ncbi:MAG: molybdopterin-guanine dinucleotide biosynthesis protein B [Nitrososphaerota archaeon]
MFIVAVMGGKNSGKTRTASTLIKGLTSKGFRVASVKHIHHSFTMDTVGKDTWKMRESGAVMVSSISPNEVAILKTPEDAERELDRIIRLYKEEKVDIVVAEGFLDVLGRRSDVFKILTVKRPEDLERFLNIFRPDVMVADGDIAGMVHDVPVIKMEDVGGELVEMVAERANSRGGRGC